MGRSHSHVRAKNEPVHLAPIGRGALAAMAADLVARGLCSPAIIDYDEPRPKIRDDGRERR